MTVSVGAGAVHAGRAGASGNASRDIAECEHLERQAKNNKINRDLPQAGTRYRVLAGELEKVMASKKRVSKAALVGGRDAFSIEIARIGPMLES